MNKKRSTESEVVGIYYGMAYALWKYYFLKGQGYVNGQKVICQDKKYAILLENNGKPSSRQMTKHINIRLFFIKDCYKREEFEIKNFPTDTVTSDCFTKPLQDKEFFKFRDLIMGGIKIKSPIIICFTA